MGLSLYFEPLIPSDILNQPLSQGSFGEKFISYQIGSSFPDLEKIDVAVLGVLDDRRAANNSGCAHAADEVRKYLYRLFPGNYQVRVADFGNIKSGFTVEDTYYAVSSVVKELIRKNIVPVIIGGGQDLTYANYTAYQDLEQIINIVAVDSTLDLGEIEEDLNSKSFLSKIILHQPNYLFNYSNIGYQTYFVDQASLNLMDKLYFDVYRLGYVRSNMEEVEPIVRNADILTFDVSSIRQSEAPGNATPSPNGFTAEEACQIVRYAGLSDKLSSVGFYEMNPKFDRGGQTAHLVAQMIWCFIDGFYNRKKDFPVGDKAEYTKYRVSIQDNKHEITFYKSNKSDRWWMDVPYPADKNLKYERHHMVPCSYADYKTACQEDVPDRWWQTFQKLC